MPPDAATVSLGEIEAQLSSLLKSSTFKSEVSKKFLQLLVGCALRGERLKEAIIGIKLFDLPADYDTKNNAIVRVEATRLRKRLSQYYAEEGYQQPVIIDLPAGSYSLTFTHNSLLPADIENRKGLFHLSRQSPEDLAKALGHFESAVALSPIQGISYAGKAEVLCTLALYTPTAPPQTLLLHAREASEAALRLAPDFWRSHLAAGIVSLCDREWALASESFATAFAKESSDTSQQLWYVMYLFTTGKTTKALKTVKEYARERPTDPLANRAYGMYLYLARHFGEAEVVLSQVLRMDRNCWLAHITLAFVYLAIERPSEALARMQRLEAILEAAIWPGLLALCLSKSGRLSEAEAIREGLHSRASTRTIGDYVTPLQLALASMACDDDNSALDFLEASFDARDPFTIWLDRLPIFDSLRKYPRFSALIHRIYPL